MKNIFLTLPFILLVQSTFGQQEQEDSHQKYGWDRASHIHNQNILTPHSPQVQPRGATSLKADGSDVQHLDSIISSKYDPIAQSFVYSWKNEYAYNTAGQLTAFKYSTWDPAEMQWRIKDKIEFSYFNDTLWSYYNYSVWDHSQNKWILSWRDEFGYDNAGNVITYTYALWDNTVPGWQAIDSVSYSYQAYNGIHRCTRELMFNRKSGSAEWVQTWKKNHSFTASGQNQQSVISLCKDIENVNCDVQGHFSYSYNTLGQLAESIYYDGSDTTVYFRFNWKLTAQYDAEANISVQSEYKYDTSSTSWIEFWRKEFAYDAIGNTVAQTDLIRDTIGNKLVYTSKTDFSFDNQDLVSTVVAFPNDQFRPFKTQNIINRPLGYSGHKWNHGSKQWEQSEKGTYYYTNSQPLYDRTDAVGTQPCVIAPSPFDTEMRVECKGQSAGTIWFYTADGALIHSAPFTAGQKIMLQDIPQGNYIYRICGDGTESSGTISKQ